MTGSRLNLDAIKEFAEGGKIVATSGHFTDATVAGMRGLAAFVSGVSGQGVAPSPAAQPT